jgi:hypothetical protein
MPASTLTGLPGLTVHSGAAFIPGGPVHAIALTAARQVCSVRQAEEGVPGGGTVLRT